MPSYFFLFLPFFPFFFFFLLFLTTISTISYGIGRQNAIIMRLTNYAASCRPINIIRHSCALSRHCSWVFF